jgi:hypothetical protein
MATLEEALEEVQKNNRVCLQPMQWQELYEMLPEKKQKGGGWKPSVPLILAAWWDTPALPKMMRLQEHIERASNHGCLDAMHRYLSELSESDWYHVGE